MMQPGDLLHGRFRLDRLIGRGGFARVFLCTDLTLGRQVAVKILNHELLERNDEINFLERFRQEARAVAALDHPNILGIHDYGEQAGTIYLVMPYVDGGTVYQQLLRGQTLPLAEVITAVQQVAAALDYAHRRGVIHRDVKPQNMLRRAEDGRLLLADFGIAKVLSDTGAQTVTGAIGTVSYMAPEQFQGQISPALDIYALGCVTFQMLTGRVPYQGSTEQAIYGHLHGPIPDLLQASPTTLPDRLQTVIEQALAKNPAERYSSAGALANALAAASGIAQQQAHGTTPSLPAPVHDSETVITPMPTPLPHLPTLPQATGPPPLPTQAVSTPLTPLPITGQPPLPTPSSSLSSAVAPGQAIRRWPLLAGLLGLILVLGIGGGLLTRQFLTSGTATNNVLEPIGATATPVAVVVAPATAAASPTATAPVAVVPTTAPATPTIATSPTRAATPLPAAPLAGTITTTLTGHTDHVRGVAWTANGNTIISGASDGSVRIWGADGTARATFSGRTFAVTSIALSPDGSLLAVGADGTSNQAQIWRVDGTPVATLVGHTDNVTMVAWSPDGQTLATSSADRTVRLWTPGGQLLQTLTGHSNIVQNVAWAPDSQRLVTASWDRTLRVWNKNGTLLATLMGHTASVFSTSWSPDGQTIASGAENGAIRLWRPDGTLVATPTGHTQAVSTVAWSPDGRTLASASFDKTIRLWTASGIPLATLAGHEDAVTCLAWLPAGNELASGSWDRTIRVWR